MSERKKVPVTIKKSGDDIVETHPSYGLVSVSHYTCAPSQNFFGSAIKHNAGVSLKISLASKRRNLSNNWFFDEQEVIGVDMTAAQWGELLSSFNRGPGVPCTITHVNRDAVKGYDQMLVPVCPEVNERQTIEEEFKAEMKKITDGMKALTEKAKELQMKPSVTKADRQEFVNIADTICRKVDSCLPFIQGQFNEAVDATIVQAKGDIEAFTNQILRQAGIEKFKDQILEASGDAVRQIEAAKP